VVEERGRLAREMHDGLAQVLGYLGVQVQTLEALVRRGDIGAALTELRQTRENILEAQAEVRENILSLRTTLAGETSLLEALQAYAAEFEVQTGIQTEVVSGLEHNTGLSPLAEAQLVRIAQEALTNVRKHSHATRVLLHLAGEGDCVHLAVTDNGRGMESLDPRSGHFGLPMMRERAEHVGGTLRVNSLPGEGTQLDVWLPTVAA
jgi:signal transduction histidine kinase